MGDESDKEKLARIDENVKTLLTFLPVVHRLDIDNALNKRDHKIAISLFGLISAPALWWICKKLGVQFF